MKSLVTRIVFLATLAMSILGDWISDRLDPTLR